LRYRSVKAGLKAYKVANTGNEAEVATCYQCWAVIRNRNRSLMGMGAVLRITMALKKKRPGFGT
jgi:hypothetical protein